MGITLILTEGNQPPELKHDGSIEVDTGAIVLPQGAFTVGVGGFLFAEVCEGQDLRHGKNTFWFYFPQVKYIKATDGTVLFRNWDLCPDCEVIDDVFRLNERKEVKRYCRRCNRELVMKE
ncbi:MAG: hypothetical protein JW885_06300 [Deltaproteobacteria bacterium]|nr:hypothetical protein [Candidatus Zymogenaceae bacterium]